MKKYNVSKRKIVEFIRIFQFSKSILIESYKYFLQKVSNLYEETLLFPLSTLKGNLQNGTKNTTTELLNFRLQK